ncbi:MAG TPA: polyprenyl synthetase family protein [Bacteroidales bacterium]|nr:polyprenyl synthetase family protein [Bacteroidales bacterium]
MALMDKLKEPEVFETSLRLIVPMDRQIRYDIRHRTDQYFSVNRILPPVSYNAIAEFADILIDQNQWNKSFKAFVMVCCGNSIWRTVVGTIPFDRRMLMLPHCLKNSNMCSGSTDELGLLCTECGNCNISGFLREAENLGYITVVTEGTAIAKKLVESGKVDAIIGVGCMEVLQKMFEAVHKYSIPAIGVPLLTCGCVDTKADSEWIKQEIRHIDSNNGFRLLNLNHLKDKTASLFTEAQIDRLLDLSGTETDEMIKDIMLAGGKRLRPLLTVLAYEAFSNYPDMQVLEHLAMSVECFHKASLIHDDIEDNDASRYGRETLHERYGIPVAINIGDLLIGEGYRLLAECNLAPELTKECLKVISQGHKTLSVGQGTELLARMKGKILPMNEALTVFEQKTAAAFKVSLLLGAVAAGTDKETCELLDRISYHIGLAFQMKDDLEDFKHSDRKVFQFEDTSIFLSLLLEKAADPDKKIMIEAFNKRHYEIIEALIERYQISDEIRQEIRIHLKQMDICLGDLHNVKLKLALHEIIGKTFGEYR